MRIIATCMIWALAPYVTAAETVLERLDHFYATSNEPQAIYDFFTRSLELPAAWEFEDYGNFASGGVSFGNVVFEVLRRPNTIGPTTFSAIAYLPNANASSTRTALERRGIALAASKPYVSTSDGVETTLWENMTVLPLSSSTLTVFICDYKFREEMNASRREAANRLTEHAGGPLGLIGLKEIKIGSVDVPNQRNHWVNVLQDATGRRLLSLGGQSEPQIELVPDEENQILAVTLRVESLNRAKAWLKTNGLLGFVSDDSAEIASPALQGLRFRLVESTR